jgi:hypothetical protein
MTTIDSSNTTSAQLFGRALSQVQASLLAQPAAVLALAIAAGMAPQPAQAQNYESIGRAIGSQVGTVAAGNGGIFSPTARIGSMVGEQMGIGLTRPLDEAARQAKQEEERQRREAQQDAEAVHKAVLKARVDAAYVQERQRLDPNYTAAAASCDNANQRYSATNNNVSAIIERGNRLVQEAQQRNGMAQR